LPTQGVYCASGINNDGKIVTKYAETLDELTNITDKFRERNLNVFVTPGTFEGYRRIAKGSVYMRSLFVDLDVRDFSKVKEEDQHKYYPSKEEALDALYSFVADKKLPTPVYIDSGTGIHAYWVFNRDIPTQEWKAAAEAFKLLLRDSLKIDPTVTADAARLMRMVGSHNQKTTPLLEVKLLNELVIYDFDEFIKLIDVPISTDSILAMVPKGLDEDTIKLLKLDNFQYSFSTLARKSLNDEGGCNQIKNILVNSKTLGYDLWTAGLSIASKCVDWEESVISMSEDHPDFNYETTIQKAKSFGGVHTCAWFKRENSKGCEGCPHSISSPIQLGKELKTADLPPPKEAVEEDAVRAEAHTKDVFELPEYLQQFQRGVNGGIYYLPPPKPTKDGKVIQEDPILIFQHDIYPVKRMYSVFDGECLVVRLVMPKDPEREFILPMSTIYKKDEFTKIIVANGAVFPSSALNHCMRYFERWGMYLVNSNEAEIMRTQMGWTEDNNAFVCGYKEIRKDGSIAVTAASPYVKKLAKLIKQEGSYDVWKNSINKLNTPGLELLCVGLLNGFGSPLMRFMDVKGVSVCLTGGPGCGKTGSLYSGTSLFMDPKEGTVLEHTENGLIGRYLALHSILFGLDEVSNYKGEDVSKLVHRVSSGAAKIRMQGSVNAERELERSAALILTMTSNQNLYDKLGSFKGSPEGEVARLIEFNIQKPKPFEDDPNLGPAIFNPIQRNYGWAGVDYIKRLYEIGDSEIIDRTTSWVNRFRREFGHDTAYRFYDAWIGAIFGGGKIAVEHGIMDLDIERIYSAVVNDLIHSKGKNIQLNNIDYKELFSEFIINNHAGILILNGNKLISEPRNSSPLVARVNIENGITYVHKAPMKRFLSQKQVSAREFEHHLEKDGFMFSDKARLSTGWKAGMHTPAVSVYAFKAIPEEVIDELGHTGT